MKNSVLTHFTNNVHTVKPFLINILFHIKAAMLRVSSERNWKIVSLDALFIISTAIFHLCSPLTLDMAALLWDKWKYDKYFIAIVMQAQQILAYLAYIVGQK